VATLRNLEAVVLGELGEFNIAVRLFQGDGILLVIYVREPFKEQQRKNVGLEVGRVDGTAQDVSSFPKVTEE
jgi:hypothetical protein